jgi:capsular exopolysaccharide synthesis family protein
MTDTHVRTSNMHDSQSLDVIDPRWKGLSADPARSGSSNEAGDVIRARLVLAALRRGLPAILALAVLGAILGSWVASAGDETHFATATIELLDDNVGKSQHSVSRSELEAEREVLESNFMREALSSALGEVSAGVGVSASVAESTTILTIEVSAASPDLAIRAAELVVAIFTDQRIENHVRLFEAEKVEIVERINEQEAMISDIERQLSEAVDTTISASLETRLIQSIDRSQQLQGVVRELQSELDLADGRILLIDRPTGTFSSRPNRVTGALQGALAGAIFCAAPIAVRAGRGRKIRVVDEVEHLYPNLPVLGVAPKFRKPYRSGVNTIVVGVKAAMREAEAFRYLRTSVELASVPERALTIALTSTEMGEGKTVTSANLAMSLALAERKTLLIDGDQLSPSIAETVNLGGARTTLPRLLAGEPVEDLVTTVATDGAVGLDVLLSAGEVQSGAKNQTGRRLELSTHEIASMYESLRDSYDAIVVDCPPALIVADAVALSAAADGVVIVVRLGLATPTGLTRVVDSLTQGGANILGFFVTYGSDDGSGYGDYSYGEGSSAAKASRPWGRGGKGGGAS